MTQVCPSCKCQFDLELRNCPDCNYDREMGTLGPPPRPRHESRPSPPKPPQPVEQPAPIAAEPQAPPVPRKLKVHKHSSPRVKSPTGPAEPVERPIPVRPLLVQQGMPEARRHDAIDDTLGIVGFNPGPTNIAKKSYRVDLPDEQGNWVPFFQIIGTGRSQYFGRNDSPLLEEMHYLASRHLRFKNTSRGLFIEPLESLNGVYRRAIRPVELEDRVRFRVGDYVIDFREAEQADPVSPLISNGEHMLARYLGALGYLEILRPDGLPGVRFPIIKPTTVLGRGGVDKQGRPAHAEVQLPDDPRVGRQHARITWRGPGIAFLEDLESKSGTWVRLARTAEVDDGDVFLVGKVFLRVVATS